MLGILLYLGLPLVSLESAERPNYFLCVTGNRGLRLEHWQNREEFRRQATFIHHQGLWLPGQSSFELHSQKGVFLTLSHMHARVQNYDNTYNFKISSSFIIEGKTGLQISVHIFANTIYLIIRPRRFFFFLTLSTLNLGEISVE